MTLNERIDSDAGLKNRRSSSEHRGTGVVVPLTGKPDRFVWVDGFKDEFRPPVMGTTPTGAAAPIAVDGGRRVLASARFLKTAAVQASPGAVESIARQTDPDEHRSYQTDVH
jgi:hypothetical protein